MTDTTPGPQRTAGPAPRPGDALLRAGAMILVSGMLVTLVALLPLVSSVELPSLFWWLAMLLVGSGMLLVLMGLLRKGRSRSRLQRAARVAPRG